MTEQKFDPGKVLITYDALRLLCEHDDLGDPDYQVMMMMARHAVGDWGDVSPKQAQWNADRGLRGLGAIISVYPVGYSNVAVTTPPNHAQTVISATTELGLKMVDTRTSADAINQHLADPELHS